MNSANPLSMYMRQPKIYIRLPSQGKFWPEGSLEATDTGEYPVYSMTAKDELSLKVPDALMNGQAVVDVIQHCMPNIKNAWHVTSLDLDVILIAIRLATYGEIMTTPVTVGDGTEMEYQVDLRVIMDQLQNQIQWIDAVPLADNLTAFVRPLNYRQISTTAVKAFETQKLMQVVNDEKIEEAEKVKMFSQGFKTLSDATIATISDSVDRIDTPQGSVSDPKIIRDFVENADKDIFSKVEQHLQTLRDQNAIKPLRVAVTDEMREKGTTGDIIEIPITFDPATFFV